MITKNEVYMGTLEPAWGSRQKIKNITFSITDECNLRCTYCYFTHKTSKNIMSFETAKKAVDDILTEPMYDVYDGVIWEFIGGEPTIEMGLIDKISDYILYKMYILNHKWLYCYRFMIGSNGLMYRSQSVQNYIKKHSYNLYFAITIDGTKEKHDLSRIKIDGSGSYDEVRAVIPLWKKQFGGITTKATFSHDDLPFLKDSIINLWNLGIKCVSANVVFEDSWELGDTNIYKQQLYELADYIIKNDLWEKYSVRFFDPQVGNPYTVDLMRNNFCGTGNMMAVNTNGDYYPCVRFMPSSLNNHRYEKLGSITNKINKDKLRAFNILNTKNQSNKMCLECDIAGGCYWCTGFNFDESTIGTIFERQTFICEMHKANVEVNKYIWRKYELIKHKISPYRYIKLTSISSYNKYLYILCNSMFPSFCEYSRINSEKEIRMSLKTINETVEFCEKNNFVPIFCGCAELPEDYYGYQIITLKDFIKSGYKTNKNYFTHLLINNSDIPEDIKLDSVSNVILSFSASQIVDLYEAVLKVIRLYNSLNISITINKLDINVEKFIYEYNRLLKILMNLVINSWKEKNYININLITNELFANTNRSCGAGYNSFTVSPEGKIYICPGFYNDDKNNFIGDIHFGIDLKYKKYCDMNSSPLCETCDVRHCNRCVYRNKKGTGEYNIPTELQCVISNLEYDYSYKLSKKLIEKNIKLPFEYNESLIKHKYYDPIKNIKGENYPNNGYEDFIHGLEKG